MHVVRDVEQLRKEDLVDKMRARPVSPRDMGENMSGRATTWSGMAHPFVKLSRIGGRSDFRALWPRRGLRRADEYCHGGSVSDGGSSEPASLELSAGGPRGNATIMGTT